MRELLDESFKLTRREALEALGRRWWSPPWVQDMVDVDCHARLAPVQQLLHHEPEREAEHDQIRDRGVHQCSPLGVESTTGA
jgi:hypothetical protein